MSIIVDNIFEDRVNVFMSISSTSFYIALFAGPVRFAGSTHRWGFPPRSPDLLSQFGQLGRHYPQRVPVGLGILVHRSLAHTDFRIFFATFWFLFIGHSRISIQRVDHIL
jgi:hypothetical protein